MKKLLRNLKNLVLWKDPEHTDPPVTTEKPRDTYLVCGKRNHNWPGGVYCMRRLGHTGAHERHLHGSAIVWHD